jgi:hypothetical protein
MLFGAAPPCHASGQRAGSALPTPTHPPSLLTQPVPVALVCVCSWGKGVGTSEMWTVPTRIVSPEGDNWRQVFTGTGKAQAATPFVCAIKADSSAWCFGTNLFGQLGNGDSECDDATQHAQRD